MFRIRIRPNRHYWNFGSAWCSLSYFPSLLQCRICLKLVIIFDIAEVSDRFCFLSTAMKFRICLMIVFALFRMYWSFLCAWCSFSYARCSLCWAVAGNWRKCRTICSSPCTSLALLSIFARFRVIAGGIVRFLMLKILYGKFGCVLWSHLG